jgi:NADH-quinone oxidoreductase subunit C
LADATTDVAEPAADTAAAERARHLAERLTAALGDDILEQADIPGTVIVRIAPTAWRRAAQICKNDLGFDYLSFISAIDWMPTPAVADEGSGDTSAPVQPKEMTFGVGGSTGRLQVFALVEATDASTVGITLKTDIDETNPHLDSWVAVYPGADWHERETWEMFGIAFDGHPSLRHLYLPSEFEGHPLRKDFPLLAREVKPWPGLVDVEPMPQEAGADDDDAKPAATEAIEGGDAE